MVHALKGTIGAITTAFFIIGMFLLFMLNYEEYQTNEEIAKYMNAPITDIYEASVFVPDFVVGDNPLLIYNSVKHRKFVGDFTIEVKTKDNTTECTGFGNNISYSPSDNVDPTQSTLTWFLWNQNPLGCYRQLTEGKHYLLVNYTIKVEGKPNRYYNIKSNAFNVYSEKSDKLFEQSKEMIINR